MVKRVVAIALALVLVGLLLAGPVRAFAAEGAVKAETTEIDAAGVTLSADNAAATIEGCAYGLDGFTRLRVGSNRDIEGAYRGYAYYLGSKGGQTSIVVAGSYAVVYVPAQKAEELGINLDNPQDQANLQKLYKALDDATATGGGIISLNMTWYFTTKQSLSIDGVMFLFDQEIGKGDYYDCIVGTDETDVTDAENPHYIRPNHACYASLVASGDATIVAQPTTWESMVKFFTTLNYSPLWVTLKTTLTAIVFIFILGLAAAYLCLHVSPRVRDVLDTIFTIPMVLPPTVCGFLLLLLLGSNTAFGRFFISIGFPLIFSWPATVIAAVVVAFPLMYRNARGAFENLDSNMLDAARTLGWSESRIFFKLMLPLSWSSIAAATVLAFARALGEFGATLFLAGNYLGVTRTIPIAIYFEWMNGNTDIALFWTAVILVFSFVVILFINLWSQHTTRFRKGVDEQ